MIVNHETQVSGQIMSLREFIGSLPADEFFVQEITNDEIEYYPVEDLIKGIAPNLDEWEIEYVVVWWSPDVAIISRPYPNAQGKMIARKSFLLQEEIAYVCHKCKQLYHADTVCPMRSIDVNKGYDIFILSCEKCYDAFLFKVYGISKEKGDNQ